MSKENIAVLGGGSWGATLAAHLSNRGHEVIIWEFVKETAEKLRHNRTLPTIPQLRLPPAVQVTNNITEALRGRNVILSAVPSHTVRQTFGSGEAKSALQAGATVISASKGIETESHLRMSEIINQLFPQVGDIVILSGPSHAEEVAQGLPVVLVSASNHAEAAERVRNMFISETFRIYTSDDPVGVELGGSLKNVYAVACGIVDGLGLGDNTKAALLTRGLAEITRLGTNLGARTLTFFGLSGLGDLIVTCSSKHSRNRLLGEKIGKGRTLKEALGEMSMVAEGVNTTKSAHSLAKRQGVEVPIIGEMYKVLFSNKSPIDSIKDLMTRQVGAEMEGIAL